MAVHCGALPAGFHAWRSDTPVFGDHLAVMDGLADQVDARMTHDIPTDALLGQMAGARGRTYFPADGAGHGCGQTQNRSQFHFNNCPTSARPEPRP